MIVYSSLFITKHLGKPRYGMLCFTEIPEHFFPQSGLFLYKDRILQSRAADPKLMAYVAMSNSVDIFLCKVALGTFGVSIQHDHN